MALEQAQRFITVSHYAYESLFSAMSEYWKVYETIQEKIAGIERDKTAVDNQFMFKEQWAVPVQANFYYGRYVKFLEELEHRKEKEQAEIPQAINEALDDIGATLDSLSTLAGTVLQLAKQTLAIRYGQRKPQLPNARRVGSQSIVEVVWEGRNHSMHWDDPNPRQPVVDMLNQIERDFEDFELKPNVNHSLDILKALDWKMVADVEQDFKALISSQQGVK